MQLDAGCLWMLSTEGGVAGEEEVETAAKAKVGLLK